MPLQLGQMILSRYRIEALAGQGAFAEVYRATHVDLNVPRALKILHHEAPGVGSTDFSEYRQRFKLEAQLGARLKHPNLVEVYDYGQEGEMLVLVMEYAPGGSLAERINRARESGQPLAVDECVRIAQEVAAGLATIHAEDIVHRDLKPSNILFDAQGHAKVADLGLAQIPDGPSMRSQLSMPAPHPGTPAYMSPEQTLTTVYLTQPSDVYALGLVLYEMLTGHNYKNVKPGTRASAHRLDTPAWLDDLLVRMLADEPKNRPWDGAEVAAALKQGLDEVAQKTLVQNKRVAEEHVRLVELEERQRKEAQARTRLELEKQQRPREKMPQKAHEPNQTKPPSGNAPGISRLLVVSVIITILVLCAAAFIVYNAMVGNGGLEPVDGTPAKTIMVTQNNTLILTLAPGVTMKLVRVQAGEFLMGSTASDIDGFPDEKPQHTVTLDEYWIGKYEVTNAQFAAFVNATGYKTSAELKSGGYVSTGTDLGYVKGVDWKHPHGPSSNLQGKDNYPVNLVSWDDAVAFCAWASQVAGRKIQLPSEAQWEKAARGPVTVSGGVRIYPWGNDVPDNMRLNFNKQTGDTVPVGQYSPNGDSFYGAADMAGNVMEWVADWYDEKYYVNSPVSNPQGSASGTFRAIRGGSWNDDPVNVRSARRGYGQHDDVFEARGFRVMVQ